MNNTPALPTDSFSGMNSAAGPARPGTVLILNGAAGPTEPGTVLILNGAAGPTEPGTVLILNGASSSGKTALVRALQDRLAEPYLDAGLDRFLWMLPRRYLERPLWDGVLGLATEAGPDGHRLVMGMHRAIQSLSLAGIHVVADHVLVEAAWVRDCASLLADLPAYLIGVRCPLEVLEQRERQRRDRTLGQARAQHAIVHAHNVYDLQVDTSLHSPQECAGQVEAFLRRGDPPHAFRSLSSA